MPHFCQTPQINAQSLDFALTCEIKCLISNSMKWYTGQMPIFFIIIIPLFLALTLRISSAVYSIATEFSLNVWVTQRKKLPPPDSLAKYQSEENQDL